MRINLIGDSPIIPALAKQFMREGYVVGERFPHFTIELVKGYKEEVGGKIIDGKLAIHSAAGSLEQYLLRRLCDLVKEPLLLHRGDSQFGIKLAVPQRFEDEISHAVLRAVNELVHVKVSWFKRWLSK